MTPSLPFDSFFMAGFECSTQKRTDGRRLDLIASTAHDRFALQDYRQAAAYGLNSVRDGLRWHLIERAPGVYDWSSWLPMLRAAREAGVQVIWDLCHYGWPEFVRLMSRGFVDSFARFAAAAARVHREETGTVPVFCPINEISFFAWSAGDVGYFFPAHVGRGEEVKRQLVRAAVAGAEAVLQVDPRTRLVWAEPLINVVRPGDPAVHAIADAAHSAQFDALEMIAGRRAPELGGRPELLDLAGLNYYPHNQWYGGGGPTIPMGHHAYTDMSTLLVEAYRRYQHPLFIAETGAEKNGRPAWLSYVCQEVRTAMAAGVPIQGICLYPIMAYPGWDNDRTCEVGLFCSRNAAGDHNVYQPLADEVDRQRDLFGLGGRGASSTVHDRSAASI